MENEKNVKQGICLAAKKCGGCQFQGLPYEKQLEKKIYKKIFIEDDKKFIKSLSMFFFLFCSFHKYV